MIKNSIKVFSVPPKCNRALVTLDAMTGDHLRVDGGTKDLNFRDWDSLVAVSWAMLI